MQNAAPGESLSFDPPVDAHNYALSFHPSLYRYSTLCLWQRMAVAATPLYAFRRAALRLTNPAPLFDAQRQKNYFDMRLAVCFANEKDFTVSVIAPAYNKARRELLLNSLFSFHVNTAQEARKMAHAFDWRFSRAWDSSGTLNKTITKAEFIPPPRSYVRLCDPLPDAPQPS